MTDSQCTLRIAENEFRIAAARLPHGADEGSKLANAFQDKAKGSRMDLRHLRCTRKVRTGQGRSGTTRKLGWREARCRIAWVAVAIINRIDARPSEQAVGRQSLMAGGAAREPRRGAHADGRRQNSRECWPPRSKTRGRSEEKPVRRNTTRMLLCLSAIEGQKPRNVGAKT